VSNKRIKKVENIPEKHQWRPIAGNKSTIGGKGFEYWLNEKESAPLSRGRGTPVAVRKGAKEFKYTQEFLDALFGDDLHAKRVNSLANATLGVMTSASFAVSTIGHGLALARGGLRKHANPMQGRNRLGFRPSSDTGREMLDTGVRYWRTRASVHSPAEN
jgi:hypothetical protein